MKAKIEDEDIKYPYLGIYQANGFKKVVLFVSQDSGMVVANQIPGDTEQGVGTFYSLEDDGPSWCEKDFTKFNGEVILSN